MSEFPKRYSFSSFFPQSQYESEVERLEVKPMPRKLFIGIPRETTLQEKRVPLVPSSVAMLVGHGHRILVETGAGLHSNFSDTDFSEAGAEIAQKPEEVFAANVILKSAPPSVDECGWLHSNQLIISPLQIPVISREYLESLQQKKVTGLAMEYLQDSDGTFPVVRIMSEMAGVSAVLTAAELLTNTSQGKGILLGGISGVPPAKVVILGAGVVGECATRAAMGLGASVRIFDNNIYKLMRIKQRVGKEVYTSSLNPVYLEKEIVDADVVIGAIHSETGRSPIVINEDMVRRMMPGSVIIDVSIDQGGCVETSEVTTHDSPTFEKYDVIHYCVPNIASKVSRTASAAISNILTPILIHAGNTSSIEDLFISNPGLRHGVYSYKGCLTNEYLSNRFSMKYTNLDLLITSRF